MRPPTVTATVVTTAMTLVSLAPGLLPRPALTQAVFSGFLVALGLATIAVLGPAQRTKAHPSFLFGAAAVIAVAMCGAAHWQNRLRAAMGQDPVGWAHWALVAIGTVAVAGALIFTGRALRWAARSLRRSGFGIPTLVALGVLAASATNIATPAAAGTPGTQDEPFAAATTPTADALATQDEPFTAETPTDAPATQGNRFVGTRIYIGPTPAPGTQGERFVAGGTGNSTRIYVGLDAAPNPEARAELAVAQLDRTGALAEPNLVIAVPTGSGWIDENAATGLEQRFDGHVAIVGVQYSTAPSWVGFLFDRAAATESARTLFDAVTDRLAELPPQHRPNLYVYGQSLGALGGASVFTDGADQDRRTCAVLWAGPPAGDVPTAGATVLANRSDPVVRWSPRLLLLPPDLAETRSDAPTPHWLPLVGFLQTTIDLLGALDAPVGHGHRYGLDQGTAMGACAA